MYNPLILFFQGNDIVLAVIIIGFIIYMVHDLIFSDEIDLNKDTGDLGSEYIRDFSRPRSLRESLRR